jgi:hypothetical protein
MATNKKKSKLTTAAGAPVVDNQNIMTAGPVVSPFYRMYGFWKNSAILTVRLSRSGVCTPRVPALSGHSP